MATPLRIFRRLATSPDLLRYFNGVAPSPSLFTFHPHFFSEEEQTTLAACFLKKLDSTLSHRQRRRRPQTSGSTSSSGRSGALGLFGPDSTYDLETGHYDGVIKDYREMHVSEWPEADKAVIEPLIDRLKTIIPDVETQTHLLQLGSEGEILPHVDNLEASGSWILGLSIGAPRVLRLEKVDDSSDHFEVLLPSGSVYVQRDTLRYAYRHSILKNAVFKGITPTGGPRISLMMRDMKYIPGRGIGSHIEPPKSKAN